MERNYAFNPLKVTLAWLAVFAIAQVMMSKIVDPPNGKTGAPAVGVAPADGTCNDCHNPLNPTIDGELTLSGLPEFVNMGETYELTLRSTVTSGTAVASGFQMTAINPNSPGMSGDFADTLETGMNTYGYILGREYIEHAGGKVFGTDTFVTWTFHWTAPSAGDTMVFYANSILSNGNAMLSGDNMISLVDTVYLVDPDALDIQITEIQQPSCNGYTNGLATVEGLNGIPPYSYIWDTGDSTATVYGVEAGTYQVSVVDAIYDTATMSVVVGQPDLLEVVINSNGQVIPCNDSLTMYAYGTGGTGLISYQWDGGPALDSFSVTIGGYYCVIATDVNNCQENACLGVNGDPNGVDVVEVTADVLTCDTPTTTLSPNVSGVGNVTYTWTGPDGFSTTTPEPTIDAGGVYVLEIMNEFDCWDKDSVDVEAYLGFEIINPQIEDATCAYTEDGTIEADLSGVINDSLVFVTSPEIPDFDAIAPGDYSVTATDVGGCSATIEFTIGAPDPITVTVDAIVGSTGDDGEVQISAAGGTGIYEYTWTQDSIDGAFVSDAEDPTGLAPGTYYLEVIDDNDCLFSFGPYVVDEVVSTLNPEINSAITLLPNPVHDEAILELDYTFQVGVVQVMDIHQQVIFSRQLDGRITKLNVNDLPQGFYLLRVELDEHFAVKSFIKQ